jgi:hypothetical protein
MSPGCRCSVRRVIEFDADGQLLPGEDRRTFLMALDILEASLDPSFPAELEERRGTVDDLQIDNAIRETFRHGVLVWNAIAEIVDADDTSPEARDLRIRFAVFIEAFCEAWRVTDQPELVDDQTRPSANRAEMRAKIAAIRRHLS